MHVNDSQAAPPSTTGKQPNPDDGPTRGRSRSGQRFRRALERTGPKPPVDGANDGASAAALAGWFRAEAALPGTPRATGVAGVVAARPVDRVLIGSGPDGAQARIRIGAGALAGTEIHVSSVSGRAVEAQLLTHAASSRQTLSVVMDEIRSRLQHKGIALSTRGAAGWAVVPAAAVDGADQGAAGGRRPGPPPESGR